MGSPPVANFDSATAMLRALARYLHGKDFPALGSPRMMGRLAGVIDLLGTVLANGSTPGVAGWKLFRQTGWAR